MIKSSHSRKGQVSLEFVLVFSMLTIFVVAFFIAIYSNMYQGRIKNENELTDDTSNFLQQEIVLASRVESGYIRTFPLPQKIGGFDYSVSISNYSLVVNTSKVISMRGIPLVNQGSKFYPGENNTIIRNETYPYVYINS
jgi:uncharacterized protein (UPF0333 family)